MADFQVTYVHRPEAVSCYEQVTHLGNLAPGWLLTRDDAIASIEAGIDRFFVIEPTVRRLSWVGVVRSINGTACLRTHANGVWNDDLLVLPYVLAWSADERNEAVFQPIAAREGLSPAGWFLLGTAAVFTVAALCDNNTETEKACGICRRPGHNRATCPFGAERINFSRAIPKSSRCECCGQYGYQVKRHHTRGRGNDSDFLDLCDECHLHCGHDGHFQNLAKKPLNCRIVDRPSWWRG